MNLVIAPLLALPIATITWVSLQAAQESQEFGVAYCVDLSSIPLTELSAPFPQN
ncbi:hypothetical protein [Vibrio sp. WXL210]|uniref:hypothetical protein n=1 Tax=Vibrio sp. WXL210 TaxID=3450709 RepID=UPI003EC57B1A